MDYANPFATTTGVIADMAFLTQGTQTALYYVTNESSQIHRVPTRRRRRSSCTPA